MKKRKYEVDMLEGSLFKQILIYTLPIMVSGILQLLYNAADTIVVGRYVGDTALAAVGSTGSLVSLIINLVLGLSVGASVAVAQFYGARNYKSVSEVVHTSILLSVILGALTTVAGIFLAKRLLILMGSPPDVLELSALYLKIFFTGTIPSMVFNYGSSILRAVGDTKRPLIFLSISGLVNVILNLVFVISFNWGVAGVAISTVISQILSAILVLTTLIRTDGPYKLTMRNLKICKDKLKMILKIGLPAGLQSSIFSLSNIMVQSSVNSFGKLVMAGNTAASNIDGFLYLAGNSFYHSALAFTGQNYGAKNYDRISKILKTCLTMAVTATLSLGILSIVFGPQLLSLYSPGNPEVAQYGMIRLQILGVTYFLCGVMEVMVGVIRGLGASFLPMLVTIIGIVGTRISWILTIFAMNRKLEILYLSYPVSWIAVSSIHIISYIYLRKKLFKQEPGKL